jgi:threonine/homoserine/homoserine lactone efflux protein
VVSALPPLYMLYLAYRIATRRRPCKRRTAALQGSASACFLGLGNPKAYAAMAALYSGFTLAAERSCRRRHGQDGQAAGDDPRGRRGVGCWSDRQ